MEAQGFMPDMQPLNPGRVQQNSPVHQASQQQAMQSPVSQSSQVTQAQVVVAAANQQVVPSSSPAETSPQTTVVQVSSSNGAPQFIAVAVADPDSQTGGTVTLQPTPTVHPTYVQYVDGTGDPNLYTTTNGQMAGYPVYSVTDGGTMYTPGNGAYYSTASGTAVTYSQTLEVAEVSFLSSKTVQWLIDNYETAEGVSLPRSTLYNHYLRHCGEHKLEPVNAASFGKLIRSVFLGLRTRRLGTRGNSKYHYYGIRVKPNSPLNQISEEVTTTALRQQSATQAKRFRLGGKTTENHDSGTATPGSAQTPDSSSGGGAAATVAVATPVAATQPSAAAQQHHQYLGDASSAIPPLGEVEFGSSPLPDGIGMKDVDNFKRIYRDHCESFLDAVMNLHFSAIESLWQSLWRVQGAECGDQEKLLSKSSLFVLCKCEPIQKFVQRADYQFYQNLVDVLIPDVLRPIPSSLTQAIRNFAKSLEGWLTSAMQGVPEDMVKVKIGAVSAFAQTLRRYTSLNHLAQAARAVLQNSSQINQMLADLNRVDFHNVQEQASWVCQCEDGLVQRLEQDFKDTLQQQTSLEQWAAWLDGVVSLVLEPFQGKADFPKAARQFLLKWSFYSSMVIRDLTLRSAASFGSFHLIRLLYDEYMFYLIEHKVSKATGKTPIAVMGEFLGLGAKTPTCDGTSPNSSLLENGSSSDSSCASRTAAGYGMVLSNGWPAGLVGQPQMSDAEPTASPPKKLKAV
ncbi:DNA-binding protein RFX2 isoform X3 [Ixodes scapularis]|uniref:DNA-binding protein RFX2 isoform X3 n=1 Tax=Ixodes scapularis TaxID=6945 RepID=UPI001C3836E7|nr:DNA-binding protein RFX2 isoform X3 [Ixodes scapularis]